MKPPVDKPPFLVLSRYHLSKNAARNAVIAVLERCDTPCPRDGWDSLRLQWKQEKPSLTVSFQQLVDEARQTGIVKRLQDYLDKRDPVFGGTHEEMATPNFQFKWKTEYAGWKREVQGPCRTACVERELTDDILDYRRQACDHSNEYDFRLTARYFRAYLSACVSILDAFINRHILLAKYENFTSPEFEELKAERRMEEKMRLWCSVCSVDDPSSLYSSKPWCHFQELREKRNMILHAVDPISTYSVKEMQVFLNKVQTGIGKLLLLLRKAHKKPALGFIERLRTAPKVQFHQIRFKGDGNHRIKVQVD